MDFPLIDPEASKSWHYPINMSIRDYQFKISKACLGKNSLVVLPTGLGKTFIASVVIYNFKRWFPAGKLLFMAPTRPLVRQQLEATIGIVEIDSGEVIELTGSQIPSERERLWMEKRIFFLTPQVVQNDLAAGICPGEKICCVIFDEAHRASGRHAYSEVVRLLEQPPYCNNKCRIVGLTATPASNISGVQTIIQALRIEHIEARSEDSPDISQYTHPRIIEQIKVEPCGFLLEVESYFEEKIMKPIFLQLRQHKAISEAVSLKELQGFRLLKERDSCRIRLQGNPIMGMLEGLFGMLISLATAGEILALHGIVPFYNQLTSMEDGAIRTRLRNEFERNPSFQHLSGIIKEGYNRSDFVSHPKILHVERKLIEHLKSGSRAIVFAQYRESVLEIVKRLSRHAPAIKAMSFLGQASGKGGPAFTQKQQLQVPRILAVFACKF